MLYIITTFTWFTLGRIHKSQLQRKCCPHAEQPFKKYEWRKLIAEVRLRLWKFWKKCSFIAPILRKFSFVNVIGIYFSKKICGKQMLQVQQNWKIMDSSKLQFFSMLPKGLLHKLRVSSLVFLVLINSLLPFCIHENVRLKIPVPPLTPFSFSSLFFD